MMMMPTSPFEAAGNHAEKEEVQDDDVHLDENEDDDNDEDEDDDGDEDDDEDDDDDDSMEGGAVDDSVVDDSGKTVDSQSQLTARGMSAHSRLALCVFLFAVLTVNPLARFIDADVNGGSIADEAAGPASRRTILAAGSDDDGSGDTAAAYLSWQSFSAYFMIWAVNLLVLGFGLVKLLVYGDPIVRFDNALSSALVKQRKRAEAEFGCARERSGSLRTMQRDAAG